MSFWNHKDIKKTRKNHSCCWCETRIESGSCCHYFSGTDGGDFSTGYMHHECNHAFDIVADMEGGFVEFDCASTRGRTDDENLPPQFNPDGSRTEEPLSELAEIYYQQKLKRLKCTT